MEYISIRKKLFNLVNRILAAVLIVVSGALLISSFINMRLKLREIEKRQKRNIVERGKVLIKNSSMALKGMAEENSFVSIKEMVSSTRESDDDFVYGVFMDKDRRAWVISERSDSLHCFSADASDILSDTMSIWADTVKELSYREYSAGGRDIIEFVAPVKSSGVKLGTVRYGVSLCSMMQRIREEKRAFISTMLFLLLVIVVSLLLIYGISYRKIKKEAEYITEPLLKLTHATEVIAQGEYDTPVSIKSNDEVGKLGDSFENMRNTIKDYTNNLEEKVKERTKQLEEAHKRIAEEAHKAGMADIAIAVLHNAGNILNSVSTSGQVIKETVENTSVNNFIKANKLLRGNMENIDEFVSDNPKGKKLMEYYLAIEEPIKREMDAMSAQVERLMEKVNAIKDVISSQQDYASAKKYSERVHLSRIFDEALKFIDNSIEKYSIKIDKDMGDDPEVNLQKVKFLQVVINLLTNAKDALMENDVSNRSISIFVKHEQGNIRIYIKDNGNGIKPENLKKIFSRGFTTKPDGHGFGLHSCANSMTEMGGRIYAESEGEGKGATFVLEFPEE